MSEKTYYEILGVSRNASPEEITAAKNVLAKEYHPDAHQKDGIDTTKEMQTILEAYATLSDPAAREAYDRSLKGQSVMQTFDLSQEEADDQADTAPIFDCWRSALALSDIVAESIPLLKEKDAAEKLTQLTMQALREIRVLREAEIPEAYWHPDAMNWLLFASYQNRNYTISYLLSLYDEHLEKDYSHRERNKINKKNKHYVQDVKNLLKH